VITIGEIPNGLLQNTKLDQYPGVFNFASTADITDGKKIVIGVCVTGVLPEAAVLNRLRLGHNPDDNSFEITEAADPPPGLNCPTSSAMRGVPRWLAAIGRLLAPKALQAASLATGGVGGSAGKLSPFAPVDPTLSATGGTGGSAGKLSPMSNLRLDGKTANSVTCDFPAGGSVSVECRPQVTIMTAQYKAWVDGGMVGPQQGNVFAGVPVSFEIGAGGGTVAPEPDCTGGGSIITINTDATGLARSCWKLGNSFGQQKVWVTPNFGGDAPEGVTFEPATLTFFANAVPEGLTTFMCELGVPDLNFDTFSTTNTGKVNVGWLRVKEPANKNTVDVAFYMSVTGQSSAIQTYPAELRVYRSNATSPGSTLVGSALGTGVSVTLPGNNGNPAFQEIRLTSPVIGDAGTNNYLWFGLTMPGAPSNRTFQYWQTSKNAAAACSNASAISLDLKKTTAAPAIRLKN
jgi:hypothetical protein